MIPSTQRDAKNTLTSSRNRSKNPLAPIVDTTQANPLGFKIAESAKMSFGQDFLLEHCLPVHQIASIKITGATANPYKDLQESPQSFGFPC